MTATFNANKYYGCCTHNEALDPAFVWARKETQFELMGAGYGSIQLGLDRVWYVDVHGVDAWSMEDQPG